MKLVAALLLCAAVSSISDAQTQKFVTRFLAQAHPVVNLVFGIPSQDPVDNALAGAGLARVTATRQTCLGTDRTYAPSASLLQIAKHRGWRVSRPFPQGLEITIPVGTYAYLARSMSTKGAGPSWKVVDFAYRLKPNANLKTLLFIAPARVWRIDGGPGVASDIALTDALREHTGTMTFEHSSLGWTHLVQSTYMESGIGTCDRL